MFHLEQVLSLRLLRELAESTAKGLARRDCFYDQFHYVNRRFVAEHFEQLAGLVVECVRPLRPGITVRDLTYVNDFVSPVNLANAHIYLNSGVKENKYGWHNDAIDRWLRPCYNLWIPLYPPSTLAQLDDQSLFDVLTPASCPTLYDADGSARCDYFWSTELLPAVDRQIVAKLVGLPLSSLDHYVYFSSSAGTQQVPLSELTPVPVVRPKLGDCYVFDSSNQHASGASGFERVGISIKFLVNNPELGFRVLPHSMVPVGWAGMFICWYDQFRTFSAYQDVIGLYIEREQSLLGQNSDKLECVRQFLLQVCAELTQLRHGDPGGGGTMTASGRGRV